VALTQLLKRNNTWSKSHVYSLEHEYENKITHTTFL